jgi:hypothetical protein
VQWVEDKVCRFGALLFVKHWKVSWNGPWGGWDARGVITGAVVASVIHADNRGGNTDKGTLGAQGRRAFSRNRMRWEAQRHCFSVASLALYFLEISTTLVWRGSSAGMQQYK